MRYHDKMAPTLSVLVSSWLALSVARTSTGEPPKHQALTRDGVAVLGVPVEGMVLIRGGRVRLGSEVVEITAAQRMCREELGRDACTASLFSDEMLAHEVTLSDFWLDRTEVTNRAFRRCVSAGACRALAYPGAERWNANPDAPATLVTWNDATAYCRWRGGRLPTEAEWERAARGWGRRIYPWGNVYGPFLSNHGRAAMLDVDRLDDVDGFLELAPAASFWAGRTPEGVFDLAGNVSEWVADWYAESFTDPESKDPKGPSTGTFRVVRGGSFRDGAAWLRGAVRQKEFPILGRAWLGFRCAASSG